MQPPPPLSQPYLTVQLYIQMNEEWGLVLVYLLGVCLGLPNKGGVKKQQQNITFNIKPPCIEIYFFDVDIYLCLLFMSKIC